MVQERASVVYYTYIACLVKNYARFGIVLTINGRPCLRHVQSNPADRQIPRVGRVPRLRNTDLGESRMATDAWKVSSVYYSNHTFMRTPTHVTKKFREALSWLWGVT
jgi:hypothetical protein